MFYDEGAVVVASTYTKVGGVYDFGFRHDPDKPLETLADYCLGVLHQPQPADAHRYDLVNYIDEYQADGLLINSIKSCNSFSAGQLLMLREVEKRTGKPAAFIEMRPGGSALFLRGQHQEPSRKLFPDDRAEAHAGAGTRRLEEE